MTSCTVEGLTDLLGRAGLETPVPQFPGSDVLHNPQEIFKAYLAQALQRAIDCDKLVAYDAIQPPNMTGMGDLVIVSPRLRLNGIAPKDLVIDLAEKVCASGLFEAQRGNRSVQQVLIRDLHGKAAQQAAFRRPFR
jgi:arginyl-tRNA synthetase